MATTKRFTISYDQETPMGMSSRNTYTWSCETNTAFNAMRKFQSEHKEYIGYDWMGNPKSAYQITGWDIVAVDGVAVKRMWAPKKNKDVYIDVDGKIRA